MCFEFEALYWAKVAEEELKKKEALKQAQRAGAAARGGSRDDEPEPLREDPQPA
jgi:hypothetical protein